MTLCVCINSCINIGASSEVALDGRTNEDTAVICQPLVDKASRTQTKVTIRELKDQRNKLIADAQGILTNSPDVEKRANAHKMLADVDAIEVDITALEKIETKQQEERSNTLPNRPVPAVATVTDAQKEKRAFEQYVRYGKVSAEQETRDLTTGGNNSTMNAGYLVPTTFYDVLTEAKKYYGNILNEVTTKETDNGQPMRYATINDTGNLLAIVGETLTVDEADPTAISGSTLSTDFMTTGVLKVSLAELQDSYFDLDAWVKNAFAKRYFRGLSSMVTLGNASNIGSLVTSTSVGFTTTASSTVIGWSDMVNLFASLDIAYDANAKWSFNAVTRAALLATVDGLGRPLYIPAPSSEAFDMVLGKQVVINPFMDSPASAAVPVLYGDHSAYLLRTVKNDMSVVRLNERFIDTNEVGFILFARAGGVLLKAGIDPIVSLKMKT